MNEGESAGERPNIGFTPAVVNRRLIPNPSASLVIPNSNIGPAVPISQMSQLPESTENTCIDKELKLRALPGKHGRFLLSPPRSDSIQQVRDISSSSICINSGGGNTSSIASTSIARSGNVEEGSSSSSSSGGGFLKSPPPQYSSLHQTKRQMRTQNAFVSSSSNSVSNNCDSKNLNEITTTVTSQIGVPATIESAEATKPVSNILTPLKTTESSAVNLISLQQQQQQLLAKKRGAQVLGTDADSIISCKKRNINLRLIRLKQIKENHADHVAEIYFLQTGGNMMDYPTWRKKAVNTPEFVNFMKQYRLEPNIADTPSTGVMSTSTLSTVTAAPTIQTVGQQSHSQNTTQTQPPPLISTNSPHGVEIKIPGVGVTPVAISTTLPAAVVQLSQLGNVPGRPQGGRHGMVFGQIPVSPITVPLVPGGTPLVPDTPKRSIAETKKTYSLSTPTNTQQTTNATAGSSNGPQEQFLKVRQEASVMQRISELQREGLWTEKRLPKLQEPQRPKAHWDYLLEEMVWLAADFAQERKWKKAAAKKCSRMVQKYFNDKALAAQKAEKAKELQLKRIAGFIAKEIKIFWSNVEKLVEFKQETKIKEKRKKALDQHLSFIVDQTEKYSQQLAVGMNKSLTDTANTSAAVSLNSSRRSSPQRNTASDDEFSPGNASSDDDEETIAKEEAEQSTDTKAEIAALQKESEMDLDDLDFLSDYLKNRDRIILSEVEHDDDEDTNQEAPKRSTSRKRGAITETKAAAADDESNETTSRRSTTKRKVERMELDSDDESTAVEDDDDDDDDDEDDSDAFSDNENSEEMIDEENKDFGLKSLLEEDENKQSQADKDDLINDAAAIAESIQPKGNTLSSTNVVTPVPFLLRHTLREYQHIGLDWLVTMHDRKLNGILADEMGLGKTIQTISLLAHLACVKGNWGPHLIVVPSSVMLNWEMEFKKWCPGFKILTYYGSQKERKAKRIGWTKVNAFHVCITSYKLVIQDHQSFRRKKWKYLILDEAQNIKNFKSQRWQLLLNFQTEQRLLLTGTPLQNNLMELWSLMHFLMPHVFQSHREFKEWFSNPMTGMIEGNSEYNDSIIKRLHKVLRPFLLRRLKCEVEKQMPKKYEHVVMCRLSKRQRYLYEDFMSRANTRETLASGNLLSVINVLMQLRKVCNHPNMFETRPTVSPFRMDGINMHTASIVSKICDYDPFTQIDLRSLNLVLIQLELCLSAYVAYYSRKTQTPRRLIEEIDTAPEPPPKCPEGQFKMFMRIREATVSNNINRYSSGVKVGTSPAMKTEGSKIIPVNNLLVSSNISNRNAALTVGSNSIRSGGQTITIPPLTASTPIGSTQTIVGLRKRIEPGHHRTLAPGTSSTMQILQTGSGRQIILAPSNNGTMVTQTGQRLTVVRSSTLTPQTQQQRIVRSTAIAKPLVKVSSASLNTSSTSSSSSSSSGVSGTLQLSTTLAKQLKTHSYAMASGAEPKAEIEQKENADDTDTEFGIVETEEMLKRRRKHKLQFLARINRRRCSAAPMYGSDLRESVSKCLCAAERPEYASWLSEGYVNCLNVMHNDESWSLNKCIKTIVERTDEFNDIFKNFVLFVPPVSAPMPCLNVSHPHPSKLNEIRERERCFATDLSPKMALLHPIVSAMATQFPDPRLIQYDCGKLQTLDRLLRELKTNQHRVLIFTQMTRMLDVLEAFLNYHGHIYLRLDGTTKVEQRQILMDRFNNDKRIFAFILSTRSGGVGINLTGADTVIFYDSDWNPTMDAQAQDRCHRIGQTRDVHIYRLVSEKTIEENILKKANQKRLLGDLAIEGGNFTTAYFKSSSIQDLFNVNNTEDSASNRLSEVLDRDRERRSRLQDNLATAPNTSTASTISGPEDRAAMGAFESALAAAEDEQDVQAAKTASAEAAADLAEFDESIPIEDNENKPPELSKAEQEVENLVKQLNPIELYAMRFVEETGGSWTAEQLRAAEAEIEQQKREWEANRLAAIKKEEEEQKRAADEDEMLTYSREDAQNQIWISDNTMELMPLWSPPTPPQDDSDLYIDYSLCFLYEQEIIPESELPPVYVKKEVKRTRTDAGFLMDGRRPIKIRKEDNYFPPRSLFDRPSPALAKLRRDLKTQRYRGNFKPLIQITTIKQQLPQPQPTTHLQVSQQAQPPGALQSAQVTAAGQPNPQAAQPLAQIQTKQLIEPEGMAEWAIYEDVALLNIIQNMQGLPLNLMLLSPGHTPNWDLVADVVNQTSRVYRTPKQCRYRYEAVIVPREEGKLIENPKKQPKKSKNPTKPLSPPKAIRALRTSQLFINDNNNSFTKLMKANFDFIKSAYLKKAPQVKQILVNPSMKNPKHAAVLAEFGVANYELPLNPVEIAARRAEKMKERNRSVGVMQQQQVQAQAVQQSTAQQQIQSAQSQQVQGAKITAHIPTAAGGQQQQLIQLQQQVPGSVTQVLPSVATIVQAAHSLQASRSGNHQQQQQIVKVVTASQNTNIMNAVQHVPISQTQQQLPQQTHHMQQQQQSQVQSQGQQSQSQATQQIPQLHAVQQQQQQIQSSQSQLAIVSIQQAVMPTSSTVVSQPNQQNVTPTQSGQIVQALPAQVATSQVVSVSQLTGVGTVFTTSGIPSNATTSSLRAQRIVTAPGIQEIQFSPRSGGQTSAVVSVSGLTAQNVTSTQIQASQLRLSMGTNQQVSGVVTKGGIPMIGAITATGKPITQPTQFQIVRQNPSRQQFKVLNTAQGNTVLQTVGGQVSVVNQSGAIIQGGIVATGTNVGQTIQLQPSSGQKVSLATVSGVTGSPGMATNVASVATVQMNSGNTTTPQRTHFMVQQRQQVKRQMVNQSQGNQTTTQVQHTQSPQQSQSPQQQAKTQILQQFTPSIQLQSAGGTGQQYALVKTSTGMSATGGTVGMTLAQIKPGQLKAAIPGVRQMQLQQIPIAQQQQRKNASAAASSSIKSFTGTSGAAGGGNAAGTTKTTSVGGTQLIVQNPKNLQQSTVTVQQIMRQQPNQIVLGKRIIPVSVSSQNARQTIQVVSAASAQGLAAGTIRTNMTNTPHTIKVSAGTTPQQAIFSVLQQQQMQRQNANQNLRLQASTGSLVAVVQQPAQQQPTTQAQANQQTPASTQTQASQPQPQGIVEQTTQSHTPATTPKRR